MVISTSDAIQRLCEGNLRYVSGKRDCCSEEGNVHRVELARGQEPFAAVLGCSDSRVPVEIVFDQGPGDLFVVRVAGNVAGTSQIASIEYAVEHLGTRLVVVLGHTGCGAVAAAVSEFLNPSPDYSGNPVLDLILPSIRDLASSGNALDPDGLARRTVRAGVHTAVDRLVRESDLLRHLNEDEGLLIAGAEYCLESGIVTFLGNGDGPT